MDEQKALKIIAIANRIYTTADEGIEELREFALSGANGDSEYFQKIYDFIIERNYHPSTKLLSLEGKIIVKKILKEVFKIPNNPLQ